MPLPITRSSWNPGKARRGSRVGGGEDGATGLSSRPGDWKFSEGGAEGEAEDTQASIPLKQIQQRIKRIFQRISISLHYIYIYGAVFVGHGIE
jgi:hypothetical protein